MYVSSMLGTDIEAGMMMLVGLDIELNSSRAYVKFSVLIQLGFMALSRSLVSVMQSTYLE